MSLPPIFLAFLQDDDEKLGCVYEGVIHHGKVVSRSRLGCQHMKKSWELISQAVVIAKNVKFPAPHVAILETAAMRRSNMKLTGLFNVITTPRLRESVEF